MFLFLVRHAESESVKDYWQTPDSKLGKFGEKQAEALGKRLKFYGVDQIFSSGWYRSHKTAQIVSKNIRVETEIVDYIHEREQLSGMYGASRDSEISKRYFKEYRENFGNLDWKFEDKEESVREVLDRASKLLEFLTENYQGKRILVVSHDMFIRCLISRVLLGSDYFDKAMARIINTIEISTTGLSLLIHDSQRSVWKVNYINNYSHLKGIDKK